jgi:GMP synthase-like glutamine amidotransferase
MKIGLLECDHVLPEFLSIAGDYRDMFNVLLPEITFEYFDVCNGSFPDIAYDCAAYMTTGSKHSVYEPIDWIIRLKEFVRQIAASKKQFIGVCFGHQMLGEALGGKVEKAAVGWNVGAHIFEISRQEEWMEPFNNQVRIHMMCQDQVVLLPEEATLLASTDSCPNAMYRVGERMLGIQGHPEFPAAYEQALIELRKERIGLEKAASGLKSLAEKDDTDLIAQWLMAFLKH